MKGKKENASVLLCVCVCVHARLHMLLPACALKDSKDSFMKEIGPGISLEGIMRKLKLQYFGHLMRRVDSLEKTDAGRGWGQEEKGTTQDEMAGWHH